MVMRRRWREWDVVFETTAFAAAAYNFVRSVGALLCSFNTATES